MVKRYGNYKNKYISRYGKRKRNIVIKEIQRQVQKEKTSEKERGERGKRQWARIEEKIRGEKGEE